MFLWWRCRGDVISDRNLGVVSEGNSVQVLQRKQKQDDFLQKSDDW